MKNFSNSSRVLDCNIPYNEKQNEKDYFLSYLYAVPNIWNESLDINLVSFCCTVMQWCVGNWYLFQWTLWQYRLWSFQTGGIKLERFFPKNQHTQRKLLNFENWVNGEVSKSAKIWLSRSTFYVKNYPNLSQFFFIEESQFRCTFFVIDNFW